MSNVDHERMEAATKIFCSYETGMFASAPRCEPRNTAEYSADHLYERAAACYHEAAHAVLSYVLGEGVGDITLIINNTLKNDEYLISYSGIVMHTKTARRRVEDALRRGTFNKRLLAYGISSAAGPAAERKLCISTGHPVRTLFTARDDHRNIDNVARAFEFNRRSQHSRYAYRRLVWRCAQVALENDKIWAAVTDLAETLQDGYWPDFDGDQDAPTSGTMAAATARSIMRKAGVHPDALGWRV